MTTAFWVISLLLAVLVGGAVVFGFMMLAGIYNR